MNVPAQKRTRREQRAKKIKMALAAINFRILPNVTGLSGRFHASLGFGSDVTIAALSMGIVFQCHNAMSDSYLFCQYESTY